MFEGDIGVQVRRVEGVATLALGGAEVFHFFDCNSTAGLNDANNLIWERDNDPLRFQTDTHGTSRRLDFTKPLVEGEVLDYSDEGVYTCRDVVTMESISLNISGGKWLSYSRRDNEYLI